MFNYKGPDRDVWKEKENSDIKGNKEFDPLFEPTAPLDHHFPQWSFFCLNHHYIN